jgi:hypothetical protein
MRWDWELLAKDPELDLLNLKQLTDSHWEAIHTGLVTRPDGEMIRNRFWLKLPFSVAEFKEAAWQDIQLRAAQKERVERYKWENDCYQACGYLDGGGPTIDEELYEFADRYRRNMERVYSCFVGEARMAMPDQIVIGRFKVPIDPILHPDTGEVYKVEFLARLAALGFRVVPHWKLAMATKEQIEVMDRARMGGPDAGHCIQQLDSWKMLETMPANDVAMMLVEKIDQQFIGTPKASSYESVRKTSAEILGTQHISCEIPFLDSLHGVPSCLMRMAPA